MDHKGLYQNFIQSLYDSLQAKRLSDYFSLDCQNPENVFQSDEVNSMAEEIRQQYISLSETIVPMATAMTTLKYFVSTNLEAFQKYVIPLRNRGAIPYSSIVVWEALRNSQKATTYQDFNSQRQNLERIINQTETEGIISSDEITVLAIALRIGWHSSDQKFKDQKEKIEKIQSLRSNLYDDIENRLQNLRAKRPPPDNKYRRKWLDEVEGAKTGLLGRLDIILGLSNKLFSPLHLGKETREGIASYLLKEAERKSSIEGSRPTRLER